MSRRWVCPNRRSTRGHAACAIESSPPVMCPIERTISNARRQLQAAGCLYRTPCFDDGVHALQQADVDVAPRIASIGATPRMLTHPSSSREVELLWDFIGIPLSVPTSMTTPASDSCLNLRARVGRRMGVTWK